MCLQVLLCLHKRKASKCQFHIVLQMSLIVEMSMVLSGHYHGDYAAFLVKALQSAKIITEYLHSYSKLSYSSR